MKKQKHQMHLKYIAINLALFGCLTVAGQSSDDGIVIDKIAAKVDNYIILKSDVEKAYLDFLSRGEYRGANAKCEILRQLIVNKMMVAQAEIDSVIVLDAEVNNNLQQRMSVLLQQFGGEEEVQKAYGKSIVQIQAEVFDNIKEQMIIQRMQSELTSGMKVTPSEVRKFFKNIPADSLPFFSTEVEVAQIVSIPKPGISQKNKVRNQMLDIRKRIENGESFADLAKKFSQDPGSASRGGELPFYSRGQLAPEFEATALSMTPGELSMPVETQFGFHLIELQAKRGNTFKTRHILISATPDTNDFQKSVDLLDSLRSLILLDSITFQQAAKESSDDKATSSSGGFFLDGTGAGRVTVEQLDPNIFFTLDTMKIGNITEPIRFQQQDGTYAYRILYYKNRIAPHQANMDEDYQKIAGATLIKKQNEKISQWFELAKSNVYIEIDPEFDYCNLSE
ncbi:MAG: peptidylprolyl isomerase [Cyclobacteriaceae bacterium]